MIDILLAAAGFGNANDLQRAFAVGVVAGSAFGFSVGALTVFLIAIR